MIDEKGMSLAAAERKKQMVQIARHQAGQLSWVNNAWYGNYSCVAVATLKI